MKKSYAVAMVAQTRTDPLDPSSESSQHISGKVEQETLDPVNTTVDIMISIIVSQKVGVLPTSVMLFRNDVLVANWLTGRDFTPDELTARLGEKAQELLESASKAPVVPSTRSVPGSKPN